MGPHDAARFSYRPRLDGVRAIAVLAVLGYHAEFSWMRGGYLGVDVFFVLSGFLITSLLLAELTGTGRIALAAFWERRARRLLPALFLVLLAVGAYAAWKAPGPSLTSTRGDGLASIVFANNWRYAFHHGSYFDRFGLFPSPLRHTWSLGIEEQFYVVWPLLLAGGWRVLRDRADRVVILMRATAVLACTAAAWMIVCYALTGDRSRVYFGTDTRAQGVLIGATLAFVAHVHGLPAFTSRAARALRGGAWLVLLAFMACVSDSARWMYSGGFLAASIAAAVVVASAARPGATGVLAIRPVVAIGRLSYGIYLWHWPIFVAVDNSALTGASALAAKFGATFACAGVSYVLVERPIRRWHQQTAPRWHRVAWATAVSGVALVVGGAIVGATANPIGASGGFAAAPPAGVADPLRVFLSGDSTMFTLAYYGDFPRIASVDARGWVPLGCGFLPADRVAGGRPKAECAKWPAVWMQAVRDFDPDAVVVEFGEWDVSEHVIGNAHLRPGDAAFVAAFTARLEVARSIATRRGARLVLLDVPCLPGVPASTIAAFNDMLGAYVARHAHDVSEVRWSELLCVGGRPENAGGHSLRPDGIHFDRTSAPEVSRWLAPRLGPLADAARSRRSSNH